MDLYVVRYVETTWESVARAQVYAALARRATHHGPGRQDFPGRPFNSLKTSARGRFVEATDRHGLTYQLRAYGYGVVATDYDDDGFVDLFVESGTNFLYHNLGNGRFESVGLEGRRGGQRRRARAGGHGRRRRR